MAQIIMTESAAPSTPASGKVAIYAKTDGLVYSKDDAGTETNITAETGSFTLTGVGWTAGITVTIYYTKIGDLVHFNQQAALTGTSNSTSASGSGIPTALRPSSARYINSCRAQDGGVNIISRAVVNTDGTIDFVYGAGASLTSWTASGTKIIQPTEFSYKL